MKITRLLALAAVSTALVAAPLAATAANATPLTVPDDYCTTTYTTVNHAAVGEPTISNPDYVAAVGAVPEVSVIEYLYVQKTAGEEKWQDSPDWNPGKGWDYTGTTRSTVITPGVPAVPAVGEPTIPNPDYVAAYDTEEATGEWCAGWFTSLTTYLTANPQGADDVSWPQTILGAGKLVSECGTQVQQDYWAGTREQINAILADGQLTRPDGTPEDSQVVRDWEFADGGDCPPVVEEPPALPPVVVPPVEPPVVVTHVTPPQELAYTGASPATGLFGLAGALAIALGVLATVFGLVTRKVTNK